VARDIEVLVDERKLKGIERMLAGIPRALPKVVTRALNKTATGARAETVREIAAQVIIKQAEIRRNIVLKRASWRYWVASLRIKGRRIPLIAFRARQTKRGATYQIARTGGRKKLPHAFLATMPSGHKMVAKRKGMARLPIRELRGPSVVGVFEGTRGLAARLLGKANRRLAVEINRQIAVLLEKGR